MSFREDLEMCQNELRRANSLYGILIKYFDNLPEEFDKYEYACYIDLLRVAVYVVGDVEGDLSDMLTKIKDDNIEE